MDHTRSIRADLGRLTLPPDSPAPRAHRVDPMPSLAHSWSESIGFDITVALGTTEYQASRLMYGPARIRQITMIGSQSNAIQVQGFIAFDTDLGQIAPAIDKRHPWSIETISDLAQRHGGIFPVAAVPFDIEPNRLIRLGVWRVLIGINSTVAAGIRYSGFVTIEHLTAVAT